MSKGLINKKAAAKFSNGHLFSEDSNEFQVDFVRGNGQSLEFPKLHGVLSLA